MLNGVLCPDCASAQEQLDLLGAATKDLKDRELPYGWGKVHGVLLILGALGAGARESSHESSVFGAALSLVTGVCILRRNRLILPLLIIIIVLLILGIVGYILNPDEQHAFLGVGVAMWLLCGYYYFRRRREFTRWL